MKFRVEFEMPAHVCFHCPLSNGGDECNLFPNGSVNCPLEILEEVEE